MSHTEGRYQQDLGFTDGVMFLTPFDFTASASAVLTRNAAGDVSFNLGSSLGPITLTSPLSSNVIFRTGFGEDLQEQFGGSGIPASAQPQIYRPDAIPAMAAAQQITPRTAFKVKGWKPLGLKVWYQITVANLTTFNVRVDKIVGLNQASNVITSVLADGANGLSKVFGTAATAINVTQINFAPAQQIYQTTDMAQMYIEFTVTTPASSLFRLYGVEILTEFNYN